MTQSRCKSGGYNPEPDFYVPALLSVFLFPALGGCSSAMTSFVVEQIIKGDHAGVQWDGILDNNTSLQGAVTSASVLGALLSSMAVFKLADSMGRRMELVVGAGLYLFGAFIEALAARPGWGSGPGLTVLILGRVIYGCGIGFSMHGAPAYIGEMSPPSVRGLLVSLKEAFIVLGILLGYLIGFLFSSTNGGWAYTYGIAMAPAAVMGIGAYSILRESTRFLYMKGRMDESRAAMDWVLRPHASDIAFNDMAEQTSAIRKVSNAHSIDIDAGDHVRQASGVLSTEPLSHIKPLDKSLWAARFRPALIAGVGLVFLQQVTGQPSVLYYAASIFNDAGLAAVATVGVAAFKLVMTMLAVFTVDKFGRKLLLYVGIAVMLVALVALAIAFSFTKTSDDDDNDDKSISGTQIVILTAMFIYIGGYQIGFGPISWLLISEVFPLEVRGQAVAVAVQMNFFWNVVTSYLFPLATESIGAANTFGIFAVIDAAALYFVFKFVPETKGLSLEDIEILLGSRVNPAMRNISTSRASDVTRPLLQYEDREIGAH